MIYKETALTVSLCFAIFEEAFEQRPNVTVGHACLPAGR